MITLEEALHLIDTTVGVLPPIACPLGESLGKVLAETVVCDVDAPPHDMSLVDGYAVRACDLQSPAARLRVIEEVVAGATPNLPVETGTATRIMTGAPIPEGADAVVMVERTTLVDGDLVQIEDRALRAGANILARGVLAARGGCAVVKGTCLRPVEIGLLADAGRTQVLVHPAPRVAVLVTGSELVPVDAIPPAGKIRNSNGPMLAAQVRRAGGQAISLGIVGDEVHAMRRAIEAGLSADLLVLSGGVSAGVRDLVPAVLESMGVRKVFHRVRLRPGKPVWFGEACGRGTAAVVLGLPGNPVSSFVCFELFVRHAMRLRAGFPCGASRRRPALLAAPWTHRGERSALLPAWIDEESWPPRVELLAWHGSADLRALSRANALVEFPAGDRSYAAGDRVVVRDV